MRTRSALEEQLHRISAVTLNPLNAREAATWVSDLSPSDFRDLLVLLNAHHVTIRTLKPLLSLSSEPGQLWREQATEAVFADRERILVCLDFLSKICSQLESAGARVVVFKTLDHWPDFGNDLDLLVSGDEELIRNILTNEFHGVSQVRSWGDHLAHKWSFRIERCPADVELHINRLGQAGEHSELAARFITRRQYLTVEGRTLPVPGPEERIIAATLQRMYRHLYFRICDIVNLAHLLQRDEVDWEELALAADMGGIRPGVLGCLELVVDYANRYLLEPLRLPGQLQVTRGWDARTLHVQGKFLHIPFLPNGAGLFCRQFAHTLTRGNFDATARLSLLPPLASVAALAYAVTGSNGRIW
jgi:putative nucleotidyltransferase-like protein